MIIGENSGYIKTIIPKAKIGKILVKMHAFHSNFLF